MVESTAHIFLPFIAAAQIKSRIALGWHERTRVIYVYLKAHEEACGMEGDSGDFGIF